MKFRHYPSGAACLLVGCLLLLLATAGRAAELRSEVLWSTDGKQPTLELRYLGTPPADAKSLAIGVTITNVATGQRAFQGPVTLVPGKAGEPWAGRTPAFKVEDPKKQHKWDFDVRRPEWDLDVREEGWYGPSDQGLRAYGLRRQGAYPSERVSFWLALRGWPDQKVELKEIALALTLRDYEENTVRQSRQVVMPERLTSRTEVDLTPDLAKASGPFSLEYALDGEAMQVFASGSLRLARAILLAPVTGFENADSSLWYTSNSGRVPGTGFASQFYSEYLRDQTLPTYPKLSYDSTDAKSGRVALKVDYEQGREAVVFSRQKLAGRPLVLSLWVKGNNSEDTLTITFEDSINYTFPAWQRNALFRQETVGSLDFEGWRRFRVPVLGDGLQVSGNKGSTPAVDAPIGIIGFTVVPSRTAKPKVAKGTPLSIAIDQLEVETQAGASELATVELRTSDLEGRLLPETKLQAAVLYGDGEALPGGQLTLAARDAAGKPVWQASQAVDLAPSQVALAEWSLAELAAKGPLGPVSLQVTLSHPRRPGWRPSAPMTLKAPAFAGLAEDFEGLETYKAFQPMPVQNHAPNKPWLRDGTGVKVVPGGVGGKGHALSLTVTPGPEATAVLLHPALRGQVSELELQIFGAGQPVQLQPMLVDSGYTGVWQRPYNVFYSPLITVDWQGWRSVRVPTPPMPRRHGEKNVYFLFEPWYPLHLAFFATTASEKPVEIKLDDLRLKTHLAPGEELGMTVVWPDASQLFSPGAPLALRLRNDGPARDLAVNFTLTHYQGHSVANGTPTVKLAANGVSQLALVPKLAAGIYGLSVSAEGLVPLRQSIIVVDLPRYFGTEPMAMLQDQVALRRSLGLTVERILLDWDNVEPIPNLLHYTWFNKEAETKSANGAYTLQPVLGYSADWAGPEAVEPIAAAIYGRSYANSIQVPVKLVDWSRFVRECFREFKGRFDEWVFWDNPDLDDAPQGIPPGRYAELLREVAKWRTVYQPKAKLIAGGFNYDKALDYLERVGHADQLPFDLIAVQMNLAELSPEKADMEGFLDDLNALLRLQETGRGIRTTELDWGIGEHLSPRQQAAYHSRAALILNSRGAGEHQFSIINTGYAFEGYGVLYRASYETSSELLGFKPWLLPKPSYFALVEARRFLAEWRFVEAVELPDRRLDDNRAYLYKHADGRLAVALWRALDDDRRYHLPASWRQAKAQDAFAFPVTLGDELRVTPLPTLIFLPAGATLTSLRAELRHLRPRDAGSPPVLVLQPAEAEAATAAKYQSTGKVQPLSVFGVIPGDRKVRLTGLDGLASESFSFTVEQAGPVLLRRLWQCRQGQKLIVKLNDGPEQTWDLIPDQAFEVGPRESTWVLKNAVKGENRLQVRHDPPGNTLAWRVEPLVGQEVALESWGILNARQTVGTVQRFVSASGGPLSIGRQVYPGGLGAHATSFLEIPLDGQFSKFSVTVGVDGSTEGRGSVIFRVFVDGKERASSGVLNGYSAPKVLEVDQLAGARRLILSVMDAGDGHRHDLANWVAGKLELAP